MRWGPAHRRNRHAARVEQLLDELARLRDENARLRLDQQRPLELATVGERARALAMDGPGADPGDESLDLLAQVEVIRTCVRAVLHDLRVAAAQLERRLETNISSTEIDRRVLDRRAVDTDEHEQRRVLWIHRGDDAVDGGVHSVVKEGRTP